MKLHTTPLAPLSVTEGSQHPDEVTGARLLFQPRNSVRGCILVVGLGSKVLNPEDCDAPEFTIIKFWRNGRTVVSKLLKPFGIPRGTSQVERLRSATRVIFRAVVVQPRKASRHA